MPESETLIPHLKPYSPESEAPETLIPHLKPSTPTPANVRQVRCERRRPSDCIYPTSLHLPRIAFIQRRCISLGLHLSNVAAGSSPTPCAQASAFGSQVSAFGCAQASAFGSQVSALGCAQASAFGSCCRTDMWQVSNAHKRREPVLIRPKGHALLSTHTHQLDACVYCKNTL
jgi:hypothetical protein